jgi:hypothetical protein
MIFYTPPIEKQPLYVTSTPSNLPIRNCGSVQDELITGKLEFKNAGINMYIDSYLYICTYSSIYLMHS